MDALTFAVLFHAVGGVVIVGLFLLVLLSTMEG